MSVKRGNGTEGRACCREGKPQSQALHHLLQLDGQVEREPLNCQNTVQRPYRQHGQNRSGHCRTHSVSALDSGATTAVAERYKRDASAGDSRSPTPTAFQSSSQTSGSMLVSASVDAGNQRGAGARQTPRSPRGRRRLSSGAARPRRRVRRTRPCQMCLSCRT